MEHDTGLPVPIKKRGKKYTHFVGVDVSKGKLDYAVLNQSRLLFHETHINTPEAILEFLQQLKQISGFTLTRALFCMESTGIYGNHLSEVLRKSKADLVIENPLHIKRSMGLMRGKDDKTDAIRIAQYCRKNQGDLRLQSARRPVIAELAALFSLRNRLLSNILAMNKPVADQRIFIKKGLHRQNEQLCRRTMTAMKADLEGMETAIDRLLDADAELKRLRAIIESVPGVGRITAIQMLISTNEFRNITCPKKFACYAGVAPFKNESGTYTGKARISKYANKRMKALLHICALNCRKADQQLKQYYERKTEGEGKPKRAVINALRSKLILRVYACVRQNRLYERRTA
ncbi:IS110 family RNA-guided transposase [Mucilaginibacter ginsenosidivorans]|uniref:IS110 family transposase n=1 Tax=Mucilaginibacter ginsenosidivorans TaxID=398053 RepID=A0A5B8UUG7_9SPHI|nr:IS110 family transposase [Mucilaginibacter ginsenosidivorans]QEC62583.1 IS110 family transposase [Mucilaginibacter ginsenosidivorans]